MCLFRKWFCCFALNSLLVVRGFNLSPKHAVVFKDPSGQEGSYFGLSVALQLDNWLLVGAPRGNSTYENHTQIIEPGVLYQCQLEGDKKCVPQLLDSERNNKNSQSNYLQHKDNSWIGGSVDVIDKQNGKIVVCGPRWANLFYSSKGHGFVNGICYVTNTSSPEKNSEKLMPLIKPSDIWYKKKPKDINMEKNISYYSAFGQAGISTHFTKDGDVLIVGAPGVMDWRGTVIRYKTNDYLNPVIPNPLRTSELRSFSYVGYSVSSGKFFNGKNKTYYVTGAPRAGNEYQGKVYIFDYHVTDNKNDEYRLEVIGKLKGKQVGEYFGAAVCTVDVNGDGLDDILVGAPHYGDKKTWDRGRLYVHLATATGGNLEFRVVEVVGSRLSGAQFGSAVAGLDDINNDGYNDFVVGAPHEDEGRGVIYIFHGRQDTQRWEFSQRIVGKEVHTDILGFGISFSKSLDIDGNNYSDFAVGAYKSGHAIVLKSRPVITYTATLSPNVFSIDFDATSFNVTACVTYRGKHVPSTVQTRVILTLDKNYQRVTPRTFTDVLTVTKNETQCMEHSVRIENSLHDFSKPINLMMKYLLDDSSIGDNFCKFCPMVDPKKPSSVISALPYATGCRSNITCKPDLKITANFINHFGWSLPTPLIFGSQPSVTMRVSVENNMEPAFLAYAQISLPFPCSLVRVPNSCETLNDKTTPESTNQLKCLMGNPLAEGKKNTMDLEVDIQKVESGTDMIVFSLMATSAGTEMNPSDNFKNLSLQLTTLTDIGLTGYADRDGIVYAKQNKTNDTQTEFLHVYEFKNFGPSPLKKVELVFEIPLSHAAAKDLFELYKIETVNDSKIVTCERSDVNISTTVEDATADNQSTSGDKYTTESSNSSELEDTVQNLRAHNIEPVLVAPKGNLPEDRTFSINCEQPDTTCVTVRCSIDGSIDEKSKTELNIIMLANLENLESSLGDREIVLFSTSGRSTIHSPSNVQQTEKNRPDNAKVTTTFHGKIKELGFNYALLGWAVGGSSLLLIFIVIILWMFGFFKRKRPGAQYKALLKRNVDD
ncbi:integrin alpha-PS3-like isoform X2 [Zootermopsis nevadensis]|uniref:integrin alpha-PS3-like isoform X2 n=1 Tax=Zootermopsis nevadensis TaxID=136037 RepID=UPI000B8E88D1|nr:integrin alpha-PS3-like isoform X2 [Zootermopsis nevadensis]